MRTARIPPVAVLALLLACGPAGGRPRATPAPASAWAKERAVLVDEPNAPRRKELLDEISAKRVVYLGEPDHYIHEKYEMRLLFIEELFARGWRRIGMEMGRSDGAHVDAYLASGDERELDRVGVYARGGAKTPRSGLLTGLPPEAKSAFVDAEKAFCRRLRALSEARPPGTPRLRWFGFDVDTDPLATSEHMAARLDGGALRTILERAGTTPPATLAEELTAETARAPEGVRDDIRSLADSWRFASVAFHDPTPAALMAAYAEREKTMFRHVDQALAEPGPVILMGHAMHLSKASAVLRFGAVGQAGAEAWRTIGTYVADERPDEVFSVWMLADHGTHFDVACRSGPCEFASKADTVEHVLAEVGPRFALPLRDAPAPFAGDVNWQQNGRYGSGILSRQADLIYFVAEVTPPRAF